MDSKLNPFAGYPASTSSHPGAGGGSRPLQPRAGAGAGGAGSLASGPALARVLPGTQPLPAGGFAKSKFSLGLQLQEDTPLGELGAALPAAAFTPLDASQGVTDDVRRLAAAGLDRGGLSQTFFTLIQDRVQTAGLGVERVAGALFQALEAQFTGGAQDSKHGGAAAAPALGLAARAAFEALGRMPGVNMEDVLRPVLAVTGQPEVLLCAWLLAQQDDKGRVRADLWGTAIDQAYGVAHRSHKSQDWLQAALAGVGMAQAQHSKEAAGPADAQAFDLVALEICKRVPILTPHQIESMLARNLSDRTRLTPSLGARLKDHLVALFTTAMTSPKATPPRVGAVMVAMRNTFHSAGAEQRAAFARAAEAAIKEALDETYGGDDKAGTDMVTKTDMRRALFGRLVDGIVRRDPAPLSSSSTTTGPVAAGGKPD